ncbi:MAG: hypothetical protein JXB88_04460 [Spirochaetales bacterium]|nr:hypothetical protein [Spirochaetales bacterium]
MNLYIVHYHLFRGGVNRIISTQVESLKNSTVFDTIYVLTGRFPENETVHGARIIKQELLYYLLPGSSLSDYKNSEKELYDFFKQKITKKDIIHVHNPSLGKNPLVTCVLCRLSREGYPLFYHCHDFAEDRPENYLFLKQIITGLFHEDMNRVMYPDGKRTLFCVINTPDAERLKKLGIPEDRIKKLPNPVKDVRLKEKDIFAMKKRALESVCRRFSLDPALPVMLYPVRAIRRKNIGEYLLLASLFKHRASWMITMAPKNPVEKLYYKKWKAFARQIKSPVIFEAGDKIDFTTLMYAAGRAVTTSIKEGFGMCFLEPWIFNTPVTGRAVPYVLPDFRECGMRFPELYNDLPVTWNDRTDDFPCFSMKTQMEIIRKMLEDKKMRDDFLSQTGVEKVLFDPVPEEIIRHNRRVIRIHYSMEKYGKELEKVYTELSG